MAAGGAVRELCEELTCPICLEYFRDPVTLAECGHSFCRGCLARSWGAAAAASCPLCQQSAQPRDLRPNRHLANIVEITRKLSSSQGREAAEERLCEKHREPLKLFCQNDEILICTVCDKSKEHKSHEVVPAEEAALEYKDKIVSCLETLKTEKRKILVYLADAEDESQEMLKIMESERQKTVAEFRTLHQLLKEQEKHLLAQIEEVEKEVARKRDDHLAKLSEELSSLESLIQEMEEKHQQPVSELLQDVRSSLQRCKEKENFENPVAFSSDLKWRLQGRCDIGPFLGAVMKQFKDTLVSELQMQKANVTLGPTTPGSKLILSKDRRSIKCQREAQDPREDPEDIYFFSYELGCEGFTSGCHFWEVSVGSEDGWAVGVARKSVKSNVIFTPEEGIWAVAKSKHQYKAFIKGIYPPLTLQGELKKIRVSLNYSGGQVSFFDADRAALLYRFSGASFSGDTMCPFFAVYAYVSLDPASASSVLNLSKNQKCMTWQSTAQNPSDISEKCYGFVLGSEGYTAGCHFWELKVGNEDGWAVGVARKSVKGRVTFTPEEGICAVGKWKGRYRAFMKTVDPPLTLSGDLRLIRVCLNYDVTQVAFFDAERATLLYEFSEASFSSALLPFFAVYGEGNLWLSP